MLQERKSPLPSPSPSPSSSPSPFGYKFRDGDRRLAFSRQPSFRQQWDAAGLPSPSPAFQRSHSFKPYLSTSAADKSEREEEDVTWIGLVIAAVRGVANGSRLMKRLALMISLNVAYSLIELFIGLVTGRVGLVSDAFHLTFGCGILTFSLFAMGVSRRKPDDTYTYGYKRLEVLASFTNALFLLFLSFSLAVEALHAFMQDESEHKHYLIVSAVTNLLVNLLGVWFFRSYARLNIVYWKPEDMNYHSVCLHVLADSIRSAGLILASWFLTLGVENAEVLCLGIVSVAVFMLVLPLFKATGSILLQIAPSNIHPSAFNKCSRQIAALEKVLEVPQSRFWELVPGYSIGSISVQIKNGANEDRILQQVNGLYNDLGIHDLTVQIDYV